MKFRIKIRSNDSGAEWWEDYEREIGQQNTVRGFGIQPMFEGDIVAWGAALIDWFNKGQISSAGHRTFLAAEKR